MDTADAPAARPNIALRILRFPIVLIVLEAIVFIFIGGSLEASGATKRMGLSPIGFFVFVLVGSVVLILVWKAFRRWVEGSATANSRCRERARNWAQAFWPGSCCSA
jgi:hypothetical protein